MMKAMEPFVKGMLAQMDKDIPAEQRSELSEIQGKMMALVAGSLRDAKPAMAKVYSDTYTEEEIDGILAFYKSPAGKALVQKMPEVMQRLTPVMMTMMNNLPPQLKAMMEDMMKELKAPSK